MILAKLTHWRLRQTAYWSPEKARGVAYNDRDDIWAVGCVASELITGRFIFERTTGVFCLNPALVEGAINDAKKKNAALGALVRDMLAMKAEKRPSAQAAYDRCLKV